VLTQFGAGGTGDDLFSSILAELKETVDPHVAEEEGTLFEQARPLLSDDEAVSLREHFEQA